MSDLRDLARGMAEHGLREGQKIAFTAAINLCERTARTFSDNGFPAEAKGATQCAGMIIAMQAAIEEREPQEQCSAERKP